MTAPSREDAVRACIACRAYDMPDECWHSPEYEPIARAFAVAVHGDDASDEQVAGFVDDAEQIGSDVWRLIGKREAYTASALGHLDTNPDRFSLVLGGRLVVIVDGTSDGSGESFASIAADLTPYIAAVVAADREALAGAVDAAYVEWDRIGYPHAEPHPVGSTAWFVERAYNDAARVIRSAPPWGTTEGGAP
jgi:hypothetical protein